MTAPAQPGRGRGTCWVSLMYFAIILIFVAFAIEAWWFLASRLTRVTFDQSREDLLEGGPFKEWLDQRTYPLKGRDLDGYLWVLAFGYLGARRIKEKAKVSGVGLK